MAGLADFGGGGDWSASYATLVSQYLSDIQQKAEFLDQKRQARQDAVDQETFDQFNAGKLSGDALLEYIRKRIRQTAYDPAQQENWKKALLQYTESINDNNAESAYANGGSIWDLIGYYKSKLSGLTKGNDDYTQTAQRIRTLTDTAINQDYQRGAERIQTQIALGRATYQDLLDFQKQMLSNADLSPDARTQILQDVGQTRARVQSDQFQAQLNQINERVSQGSITPAAGGQQLIQLLTDNPWFKVSNSSQYYQVLDDANKLIYSTQAQQDESKIDYLLSTGKITGLEAQQQYYDLAQRVGTFDPNTYYQLMTKGYQAGIPDPTQQLANPNALNGIYGPNTGSQGNVNVNPYSGPMGSLKWISQLDGTAFADINCAAASTAMLAHVMGIDGLSGGDIRYLSHDTAGGLTLDQDAAVLKQLGAKGLTSTYSDPISFAQFKQRIMSGAPAVLSGIYGNVASNLRVNPNLWGTHQMFIAQYDPKRNAFLVLDPAVSKNQRPNYKGDWWPASQVQNFGWGPALNGYVRYGQALFAPQGTLNGTNVTAKHIRFVSVDDRPQRPDTPRSYFGLHNPGNIGSEPGVHPTVTQGGAPKNPAAQGPAGMTRPQTPDEVKALLSANEQRMDLLGQMINAYGEGKSSIDIAGEHYALDASTVANLAQEQLHKFDWDIALNSSLGNVDTAESLRNSRADFVTQVKTINAIPVNQLWGTLIRDVGNSLKVSAVTPSDWQSGIDSALQKIKAFQQQQTKANAKEQTGTDISPTGKPYAPTDELSGIDVPNTNKDLQAQIDATVEMLTIASDPNLTAQQKNTQIAQINSNLPSELRVAMPTKSGTLTVSGDQNLGGVVSQISNRATNLGAIEQGNATIVLAGGDYQTVPLIERANPDDPSQVIKVPDLTGIAGDNAPDPTTLPSVIVDGPAGKQTVYALPTTYNLGNYLIYNHNKDPNGIAGDISDGTLSTQDIAKLTTQQVIQLESIGAITTKAATLQMVTTPPRIGSQTIGAGPIQFTVSRTVIPGQAYVQDPGTKGWAPMVQTPDGKVYVPFVSNGLSPISGTVGYDQQQDGTYGPGLSYQPFDEVPIPDSTGNPKGTQQAINRGSLTLPDGAPIPSIFSRDDSGNVSDQPVPHPYDPSYVVPMTDLTAQSQHRQDVYAHDSRLYTPNPFAGPGGGGSFYSPQPYAPPGGPMFPLFNPYENNPDPFAHNTSFQSAAPNPAPELNQVAQQVGLNVQQNQNDQAAYHRRNDYLTPPPPPPVRHYNPPNQDVRLGPRGPVRPSPLPRIGPPPPRSEPRRYTPPPPPPAHVGNTTVVKKNPGGVGLI